MNLNFRRQKGITLIALVITIIVLLILAGVTIASLTGENGILTRAETARKENEESTIQEKVRLAVQAAYTEGKGRIERDDLDSELKDLFGTGKYELSAGEAPWTVTVEDYEATVNSKGEVTVSEVEDQDPPKTTPGKPDSEGYFTEPSTINGGEVSATNPKIPAGFMPVDKGKAVWGDGTSAPTEEAVDEGLVIQDRNYNEFVWIPVPKFTDFIRESGYANGSSENDRFTTNECIENYYHELAGDGETIDITANEDVQEAQKMYKSVKKNQGFYIGRYETGFESDTAKIAYTAYETKPTEQEINEETKKLLIKSGVQVYSYVPWGATVEDISPINLGTEESPKYVIGAVQLARNFGIINNYTGAITTLCYSVQWDAMMRWMKGIQNQNVQGSLFIQDSTAMGWYKDDLNKVQKTGIDLGSTARNKVKNIYDIAGNVREWTMESYCGFTAFTSKISRGGSYHRGGRIDPVSCRIENDTDFTNNIQGFRISLYLDV